MITRIFNLIALLWLSMGSAMADIDFSTTGFFAPTIANDIGANLGNNQAGNYSLTQSIAGMKNVLVTDYFNVNSFIDYASTNVKMVKKFQLRYLMIDKTFNFDSVETGVRLGRIKHKYGFYGSYYNEPTLTEFIYLPQALYRDTFNKVSTGGDGVQMYFNDEIGNNIVHTFFGVSKPTITTNSKELVATYFFSRNMGFFDPNNSLIYDANLSVSNTATRTTYNLDIIDLKFKFVPSPTIKLPNFGTVPNPLTGSSDIDTKIATFGIRQYFDCDIDVTGEYVYVTGSGDSWDKASSLYSSKPPYGYLVSVRKVTDKYTLSLTHDGYVATSNAMVPIMLGMNDWNRYTFTTSLAGMYKLSNGDMVKAQLISGEGTNTLIQALNQQSAKYWHAVAFQYVIIF